MPALSGSVVAQRDFRSIEARFADYPPDRRPRLEPELRAFLVRYGTDDVARLSRVELGWILATSRKFAEAESLAEVVRAGPPGAPRDFADVVLAAARRRAGKIEATLELLQPLRGKIADPTWRGLYQSELVEAFVAARRFTLAMSAMLDWAEQATPIERDAVVVSIEGLMNGMPSAALEAGIRALTAAAPEEALPPARLDAEKWLVGAARARLVRSALSDRDPDLARWLVESMPPQLRRDDTREALESLAATQAVAPRVAGRAIGVVLDVTDDVSRRRSADLVSGVSHALGLPSATVRKDSVRLLTRDAPSASDVDQALSGLAGDGASILVAGVTDESALAASLFAARSEIPVIVLRIPSGASSPYSFVVGEEPLAEEKAIAEGLARVGAKAAVRIGFGGASCELTSETAGAPRFPVAEWKRAKADALVLAADAHCATDAIAEASSAGLTPWLVLGLEAAPALATGKRVWVSAGHFPFAAHSPDAAESAWMAQWGAGPTWYEVLGRDAAVLAAAALADFPLARVDDASAVEALHHRAQSALGRARAALWSTSATGFEGKNVLAREFHAVVEGARP